jgi:Tol biopolymer transport system component
MYNVFNNTKVQLTYNIPETWGPSWSPDGKKIVFVSGFGGNQDIYMQEINSTMPARPFLNSKYAEIFPFWTLDGRYILYSRQENDLSSNSDLCYIEPKENNKAQKLFVSPYDEIEPKMSPDDKYVVFISNKSGQYEAWVTNYPEADHLWQISFSGGNHPLWIKDEIFFVNTRTRELMSVKVKPGPEFGVPQKVISADSVGILLNDQNGPKYTMTNDGKNIIAVKASNNETINSEINFVENWSEEFKNKEKAK